MRLRPTLFLLAALAAFSPVVHAAETCNTMSIGQGASLHGFIPFPTSDPWREVIASAPVAANSNAIIGLIGASKVHPDFGASDGDTSYGMPYNVVSGARGETIHYQAYGSQSDPGPMPIPAATLVEGYPNPQGDKHALVIDRDNCFLYELFNASVQGDGSWNADSGVVWDLLNNENRPLLWTSADAAGLPVFPGLARYDEVADGVINHALRFTLRYSAASMVAPATHFSGTSSNAAAPPMGTRLRLKANYDISGFPAQARVVLQALKTYGMILADNGSNLYISGTSDARWDNDDLHQLGRVPATEFEVIAPKAVETANSLPKGAAPVISSFTASASKVASGKSVTLRWSGNGASYFLVTPSPGAVRGTSVTVAPTRTTKYTLYSTNSFGRTTKTVTVTVP